MKRVIDGREISQDASDFKLADTLVDKTRVGRHYKRRIQWQTQRKWGRLTGTSIADNQTTTERRRTLFTLGQ